MNYYALKERVERLRAHIRRRGKRGDQQALTRLVQLRQEMERCRVSSLKTSTLDLMLQELYSEDAALAAAFAPHPIFAMLSKATPDPSVSPNRAYIIPTEIPMTRIVDDDPPIKTGVSSKEYRDNWDRIFGDASGSSHDVEARRVAPAPDAFADPDEIDIALKSYADLIVPLGAHEPDCESLCTDGAACNCGALYDE